MCDAAPGAAAGAFTFPQQLAPKKAGFRGFY
jgi:hypothetical protein